MSNEPPKTLFGFPVVVDPTMQPGHAEFGTLEDYMVITPERVKATCGIENADGTIRAVTEEESIYIAHQLTQRLRDRAARKANYGDGR